MRDVPANFSVAKQSGTVWCSPMIEMELFFRVNSAPLSPPENLFFFASSVVLLSYLLNFTKTRAKEKALKPLSFKAFSVVDDTGLEPVTSRTSSEKHIRKTIEKP